MPPDPARPSAPPLGIIMLDTTFERPPGDVGHASSWPFPVLFEIVRGATARRVVGGQDAGLGDAFVQAGEALRARGAVGIITSCGFLAARQRSLAALMPLPLATSSLMQLPLIDRCLPHGKRTGVVTYDADALTSAHFVEVGADPSTPVVGLPENGALRGLIERGAAYDADALARDVLGAAGRLMARGDIGAILMECTNLPPFSKAVADRFEVPVFDIITLGRWFYTGLLQAQY
ncbi:aspartate/glutamate racemase family protein [Methylobacterium nonmethylotrophicum]|uniref:Aspartate/glutamate racemase family protein n=1 Tax=Methylobacterium nonmethylotrophicum TaxID=1141884 RepID=A0A4Z0NI66_9HYPH|nr:aspartate/glutamate racemase family protein [Methylobacterium nonmethylotrophicum]TGD95374.1 aspartate/glutamate racemase family protein [Methylobacterium nonmethylotrophicum]